jgi:hypothetical protein
MQTEEHMDDNDQRAPVLNGDKSSVRTQFMIADRSAADRARTSVTDERRAVRFFWSVLILATCASVAGNVTHAVWNASDAAVIVAALAALVPPMVLLGTTHSVGVLARARSSAGFTYWATMTITITLALCAFVLSFDALRSVAADLAGFKPAIAWLWPLCIDLSITGSTLALLSFTRQRGTTAAPVAHSDPSPPPPRPARRLATASTNGRTHISGGAPIPAADRPKAVQGPANNGHPSASAVVVRSPRWSDVADRLVREGRTKIDAVLVAKVLALTEAQTPPSTVARRVGVHHSAVRRILAAAPDVMGPGCASGAVPGGCG